MLKVVFLGTNGWYDTATGNTTCILLKTEDYYILFDAGNGIYKVDSYCREPKVGYLFISHFHLDHIIGLHILNKIKCFTELHIYGPQGTIKTLTTIINQPFTMPINQLPYSVKLHELPEEIDKIPFCLYTLPLLHSSLTLGYRIELEGKKIVYCPDTGFCENAITLAKDADLLIAECAYKQGQENPKWQHLNPETAARIAKEANAKKLVLVHFDASLYTSLQDRQEAEAVAKKYFMNVISSRDGLEISL